MKRTKNLKMHGASTKKWLKVHAAKGVSKLLKNTTYGVSGRASSSTLAPAIVRANAPVGPRSVTLVLDFASELTAEDFHMVAGEIVKLSSATALDTSPLGTRARMARQLLVVAARAIAAEIRPKS